MPQTVVSHVTQSGRIRLGARVEIKSGPNKGKPTPTRLKHFRLTSNSKSALRFVARKYGGDVQPWTVRADWQKLVPPPEEQWELFTTSDVLDILFHPGSVMHTSWEQWAGGFCTRYCNGQYIVRAAEAHLVGEPCLCPSDPQERKALAAKKPPEACEEMSRISVFLEGVPLGQWRVDTKGFYAPAEIRGLQEIMASCELGDLLVRAQMRLEWRTDKRLKDGKPETLHYPLVVIEPRQSTDELVALGEARRQRQLHPATERKQLAEHSADLSDPVDPTAPPVRAGASSALPAGEAGAEYIAQIEAAILAQPGGEVERWYLWAEKHFQKDRTALTVEEYQRFLDAVRVAAQQVRPGRAKAGGETGVSAAPSPQQSRSWDTLRIHQDDGRLPPALLDRIAAALATAGTLAPTSDADVEQLAMTALDVLDNVDDPDQVNGGG